LLLSAGAGPQQISIDSRFAAGSQQQISRTPLLLSIDGTDRRTDG